MNKRYYRFGYIILLIGFCCGRLFAQKGHMYFITDYGAVGNGRELNTAAIQRAIDKAHQNGGGTVVVPAGKFLTGALQMKSKVELHLEKNAVLLGSINPVDYHPLKMQGHPVSPKQDDNSSLALIVAYKASHIAVTGPGTIDGQGTALALNIDSLYHIGQLKDPDYAVGSKRPNEKVRPKLFLLSQCSYIDFEDATLKNAACWGLSFELCSATMFVTLIFSISAPSTDSMAIAER